MTRSEQTGYTEIYSFELVGMAHLAWLSNRTVMRSGVES